MDPDMDRRAARRESVGSCSVLDLLYQRQLETDCCRAERIGCRIVREIILQASMTFTPVWKKTSNKHVCIGLDRRVYFDNHQICHFNEGLGGKPRELYRLPTGRFALKIWAVILYHAHIRRYPSTPEEREVCLLVLTTDGFLKVLNGDTGVILRSIFLSSTVKFRYLLWADYCETVQIKSIQTSRPPSSREGGREGTPNTSFMTIAVFKIHPVELVACFKVDRHIFGENIKDAFLSEDLLVVVHRNHVFRYYSMEWMKRNCTVVDAKLGARVMGPEGMGEVGGADVGVPVTLKLTERPPLLFETKSSSESEVDFGGSPTVYIHNGTPSQGSVFHVRTLHSGKLVGELSTNAAAWHHDLAVFHFQDYRRILHVSDCTLSCYHLSHGVDVPQELVKEYSIDFRRLQRKESSNQPVMTSSGRMVKRRVCTENEFNDFESAIQVLDYENELDLLYAVITLSEGSECVQALLCFVDERTGLITKTVPLPSWNPHAGNSIHFELDCILHLVQAIDSRQNVLHYYRLQRACNVTTNN